MTAQRWDDAKYQQIADDLRKEIQAGTYRVGEQLPGENSLMRYYRVARMTVRQAIGVLRDEGFVETRMGLGVFVTPHRPHVLRFSSLEMVELHQLLTWVSETHPEEAARYLGRFER